MDNTKPRIDALDQTRVDKLYRDVIDASTYKNSKQKLFKNISNQRDYLKKNTKNNKGM